MARQKKEKSKYPALSQEEITLIDNASETELGNIIKRAGIAQESIQAHLTNDPSIVNAKLKLKELTVDDKESMRVEKQRMRAAYEQLEAKGKV